MKKLILILSLMLFTLPNLSAQEFVEFGVKGGVNFSSFSGDGFGAFDDPNGRTSFHLGLLAEIPVSERFSVQPEVLYSSQGYDILNRNDANDIEYQLDYINIPVLAKIYLIEGLSFEVGPQVGFLVKNEVDFDPSAINEGDIPLDDDQFNSVDFGLSGGASYKFINGFFINARYNAGLSDIYEDSASDAKNSVFQLGVGFMF